MGESKTPRQVGFGGKPLTLEGTEIQVGEAAPSFTLVNGDLKSVSLSDFRGRVILLTTVPSLDTSVCNIETRRFDQEVAKLAGRIAYITVSMDLPFAQKRWCGTAETQSVVTLSDYKNHEFGKSYGIYLTDLGLLARAVFVIDAEGIIRYREIVAEVTHEPDYEAALTAVKGLLTS